MVQTIQQNSSQPTAPVKPVQKGFRAAAFWMGVRSKLPATLTLAGTGCAAVLDVLAMALTRAEYNVTTDILVGTGAAFMFTALTWGLAEIFYNSRPIVEHPYQYTHAFPTYYQVGKCTLPIIAAASGVGIGLFGWPALLEATGNRLAAANTAPAPHATSPRLPGMSYDHVRNVLKLG